MNVYGRRLKSCSTNPLTGYQRTGSCILDPNDEGTHTVCAIVTNDFLYYTYTKGNDLITPRRGFRGLREGDKWCLCALRWLEAYHAGAAPYVIGEATHIGTLRYVPFDILKPYLIEVSSST